MLALTFVLSLAVLGQCQDQGLIQSFADPMANQYQRAPLFFNPITYTFYQTVRGISTSSTYCFTTSAGCAPIRKLNEDIVPSLVQSVEPTAAPEEPVREARKAQYEPYAPYYPASPYYQPSPYYAPYIRGSFGQTAGNYAPQQRWLLAFTNSIVTLFTSTITSTYPITVGCLNPIPAPACQVVG